MSATGLALRVAGHVPPALWWPVVALGSRVVALRPPRGVRQWQLNASIQTGREPSRAETARAVQSWARNLFESAQLARWSEQDVLSRVVISPEHRERLVGAHRHGGAVVALPHMGSWDLAGAWACLSGMPVSTVAEELADEEFAFFVEVREALGMKVYGHRDRSALSQLVRDQRDGHLVCLVADRNLGSGGIEVAWPTATGSQQVKLPAGAAHVALRTGASLLGIACHYEGHRMRLVISEPIRPRPGSEHQLGDMTQQLADFFAAQTSANVVDWHMLQPFFAGAVAT